MRTPARIAAFAVALGLVTGAAALAGAALDPLRDDGAGGGHAHDGGHDGGHDGATPPGRGDLRMTAARTTLPRARDTGWAFRVVGAAGAPVTGYDVRHERRMHLIVVRHDLTGFRHLHPALGADGTWRVRLSLPEAGTWRAYADFSAGGEARTLSLDLQVPGPFAPRALPEARTAASTGPYRAGLTVTGGRPGGEAVLSYALSHDGRPLDGVEPYLGADGHLVALREGDGEFLHVHPEESGVPGTVRFGATLPTAGRYRLFMQFAHDGAVRTVAHTLVVPG